MLNDDHGIVALAKAVHWLEDTVGVDTLWLGRRGFDRRDSFTAEICGAHLFYSVRVDGSWIFVSAQPMDEGGKPEPLIQMADNSSTWRQVCRLIAALERNQIKALRPRPLEFGSGENAWMIA